MSSYLSADADLIRSQIADKDLVPSNSDDLFLIYALLLRSKGADVTSADVHDAWAVWMTMRNEKHAALVPFNDLDKETKKEDGPFVQAIRRAAGLKGGATRR
ncbi:DUF7701 domain-containing protein [Micromonospora chalcea]|uniref:DUF7701 domain-containing protein n=1 Tax=Micromonospora chalcea TaxID=1874 RepID=UPI00382841E7